MPGLMLVREAIASTLTERIEPLTGYAKVPASPIVPAAIVARPRATYGLGMGPEVDDVWTLELWLLLAQIDASIDEDLLTALVAGAGRYSIRQAIHHSTSVRGDAFGLRDCKARNLRLQTADARFEAAGLNHLGAVMSLDVICAAVADPPEQEA